MLYKDGKPVKKGLEIKIQKKNIKIKLRKPKRGDKGVYELRLKNVKGEASTPINVSILGKNAVYIVSLVLKVRTLIPSRVLDNLNNFNRSLNS